MNKDAIAFLELVEAVRDKKIVLTPQGLAPLLDVSSDQFCDVGEWVLKNAHVQSVSFELWLRRGRSGVTANFWLSDVRFGLAECRQALENIFGQAEYMESKNGAGGWLTYCETAALRPARFIFDGAGEELYLEMIVVG